MSDFVSKLDMDLARRSIEPQLARYFKAYLLGNRAVMLKADDVRQEAVELSTGIFASFDALRKILDAHEQSLHRRWSSKSKLKRTRLLRDAWPNIPDSHRPDFEAFMKESEEQRLRHSQFKDCYLFPLINLEDLTQKRPLLLLLNSRGRNQPEAFAMADARTLDLPIKLCAIVPDYLDGHTMLFRGKAAPETYGQLVSWDEQPSARQWLDDHLELQPGIGIQVLRIQHRLLAFLVHIATAILHDIDLSFPHSIAAPAPAVPVSGPTSLIEQKMESAYRLPSAIDLAWLESVFQAELDERRDHLIALREDPAYFADVFTQYKEHRFNLVDWHDRKYDMVRSSPTLLWEHALLFLINDAHGDYESAANLCEQLRALRVVYDKYAKCLDPAKPLPRALLVALLRFRFFLEQPMRGALGQFEQMWVASPPMRQWFERRIDKSVGGILHCEEVIFRPGVFDCPSRTRLMMLIQHLWDDDKAAMWGREFLVDELEYFIDRDERAKAHISPRIAHMISSLGVILEGLRQIALFQPWASNFDAALKDYEDEFEDAYVARMNGWEGMHTMHVGSPLIKLAMPTDGKFDYPTHKQRTQQGVEAMRRAEHNLDVLWRAIDATLLLGKGRKIAVQRTPEWSGFDTGTDGSSHPALTNGNLLEYYHDIERRSQSISAETVSHLPPKAKKGRSSLDDAALAPSPSERKLPPPLAQHVPTQHPPRTYSVPRRMLKVFNALFFVPNVTATPGDVPWRDFIDALACAGLQAEKLRGSAWRFTPSPLADEHLRGSILFHEPHPSDKLAFWVARRYGIRLRRLYGWHSAMFVAK